MATVDLAYWLEARRKAYCNWMGEIQQLIIHMLTLDKEERDRRRREANPFERTVIPKVLLMIKLHYSTAVGQRRLDIKELPTILHRSSGQQKALTYDHRFLRTISIRPTLEDEPGVTWLELVIAFELHGGKLQLALPERAAADKASPMSTTRQLLFLFNPSFVLFLTRVLMILILDFLTPVTRMERDFARLAFNMFSLLLIASLYGMIQLLLLSPRPFSGKRGK